MILADYNCPRCNLTIEDNNGKIIHCPKCDTLMDKVFGGRANGNGHDYRFRDE